MLKIYNTLGRKKEEFVSVEKGKTKMYVCGMTVYSDAHIGHARTYVAFDIIRRCLEYKGYEVTYVQNITDVDDKIIKSANDRGMPPLKYSAMYTERCLSDMKRLGIREADIYPKASEHIEDIIDTTKKIIENGYGYVADGDVYFSVEKFKDYGKLSGQKISEMKAGTRIELGEKKKSPLDFALWKNAKAGEPYWQSPWGKGRPGWHIECSTMSSKYLGLPFDIHGGGHDLIFPHHENEIAQTEAAYGKKFVNYWLHSGMLKVNGEKMSKSLGNIINIKDALEKWDAELLRFFFASYHYRSPADFSEENLDMAHRGLDRLKRLKDDLQKAAENADRKINEKALYGREKEYYLSILEFRRKFEEAMDDDFNTPEAIASLFEFVKSSNKYIMECKPDKELSRYALDTLLELGGIITLFQDEAGKKDAVSLLTTLIEKHGGTAKEKNLEGLMEEIIEIRQNARKEKDWKKADAIRDELAELGFEIQDTSDGTKWRMK
ncbi:MAG: cysteine--tRNA ligase [Candidatus Thermoplasmatota archaeon]|nr:cysteine--tRNA ligase [Candidatus Thermoplasmatota archaeon]